MSRSPQGPSSVRVRRRSRVIMVAGAIVFALALIVIAVVLIFPRGDTTRPSLAVASDTPAAGDAASTEPGTREHAAAAYLAQQPTATWLVPERDPIGRVGDRVRELARDADRQRGALTLVVYGLPERDCGNYSAGGLQPGEYDTWTREIGDALRETGTRTIVAVEPDSIALSTECGDPATRAEQLQGAVANLSGTHVSLYIDGGHSDWHSPEMMAELIRSMGVIDDVRGFTTNVSNYNADDDEREYAHALSSLLGGAHAVIDTSRNGAGSIGEWCNPPDRLIGARGGTYSDDVVDTNLWIKAPGESDGTCNGGPPAGRWWPEAAVVLTREVVD